jgi:hypothetical protein
MITVLFSSAGRRTELLNCFRHDALLLGESLRVLAVDVQLSLSREMGERVRSPWVVVATGQRGDGADAAWRSDRAA